MCPVTACLATLWERHALLSVLNWQEPTLYSPQDVLAAEIDVDACGTLASIEDLFFTEGPSQFGILEHLRVVNPDYNIVEVMISYSEASPLTFTLTAHSLRGDKPRVIVFIPQYAVPVRNKLLIGFNFVIRRNLLPFI